MEKDVIKCAVHKCECRIMDGRIFCPKCRGEVKDAGLVRKLNRIKGKKMETYWYYKQKNENTRR